MILVFITFGKRWELSTRRGAVHGAASGDDAMAIRDEFRAVQVLRALIADEKGLNRCRSFLSHAMGWHYLSKLDDRGLLTRIARELQRGSLRLTVRAVHAQPLPGGVKRPEEEVLAEAWVEPEPEPAPVEMSDGLVVSYEAGLAVAESNRELAESGTPLKELCTNGDCQVCNAQLAVSGN